jgi:excisionase family DNA binding protein
MPTIISGHELAERLGVPYADVMMWARDGLIPCIRDGRRIRFNLGKVLDALERSATESRAVEVG